MRGAAASGTSRTRRPIRQPGPRTRPYDERQALVPDTESTKLHHDRLAAEGYLIASSEFLALAHLDRAVD